MAWTLGDLSDRRAVLAAISEFDELGREAFLAKYKFGRSSRYYLVHEGEAYDIKALVGAAYGHQFPNRGHLKAEDFTSGLNTTVPKLRSMGFEVVDSRQREPREASAFLFQSNPRYYDIARAIRSLAEMNWTVAQSQNQIKAGHRVYIWQSRPGGGVVAVGTILTDPATMPDQEGKEFILDPSKFDGEQLRVRLSLDTVLSEPLSHEQLKEHPVLKDLGVLHSANATNYKLPPEHDAALWAMIAAESAPVSLEERIKQWREEIGYPTQTDERRIAARGVLADALSEENLDTVIGDPGQFELLKFPQFAGGAYGGPGPMSNVHRYVNSGPEAKQQVAQALRHVLYDDGDVIDRLNDVLLKEEWKAYGFGESLATKALAVVRPGEWLPLFQSTGFMGKGRLMESPELGIDAREEDFDEMSPGERIKRTNDILRSVLDPHLPEDPWGQGQFLYWLRQQHAEPPPPETDSLAELAHQLFLSPSWLENVVELLEEKGQVIFQGPPGTGKTFVARELARHFERAGGGAEIVQFHPSYAYEDFVQGYRPHLVAGQPSFKLLPGPLMRLAQLAEADQNKDHRYVLVIDELNRGNLAKVFGEFYFLLEYRGERIRLQYSEDSETEDEAARFGLPKNLWIIATMNTADRSIALMDAALRRRFYFVDYYVDQEPVSNFLSAWLAEHGLAGEFGWLTAVLEEANKRLDDREAAVGPSHFLLKDPSDLTDERIARIWKHAVIPYLQEQLMGEQDALKNFELDVLKAAAQGEPSAVPPEGSANGELSGESQPLE